MEIRKHERFIDCLYTAPWIWSYPSDACIRVMFPNVKVVTEQAVPNGDFPTVSYPKPEEQASFNMAMKLGQQVGAELLLATDPDAD